MTRLLVALPAVASKVACALNPKPEEPQPPKNVTTLVIGSGFGGTITGLTLARAYKHRAKGETVLMLERGTWWTTPLETVQDKKVITYDFLRQHDQPVQYWPAADHIRGFLDIFFRCMRRKGNETGLYDLTTFGRQGTQNDGVTVARASGVGGGSLVYSNVTIRPPNFVFDDPRWPQGWKAAADKYFKRARHAIGVGVLNMWDQEEQVQTPTPGLNTGLRNIVTRSARLTTNWKSRADPDEPNDPTRQVHFLDTTDTHFDPQHRLWIDRARVFQQGMSQITKDFGTVDSSINDLPTGDEPYPPAVNPPPRPYNYCERQGRCIIGCLPGARHTLNKQLMAAIYGRPNDSGPHAPADLNADPTKPTISLEALSEVDVISERQGGGYEVTYVTYGRKFLGIRQKTRKTVIAQSVIVAAGCVGTSEILLRSRDRAGKAAGLPHLSAKLGHYFSTNGDYLAFLDKTEERVSLTRGPITTSFGHFQRAEAADGADPAKFHTIEDNGVPRPLSGLAGSGVPILQSLVGGNQNAAAPVMLGAFGVVRQNVDQLAQVFQKQQGAWGGDADDRLIKSDDELTAKMMCIAAMGREAAVGQFEMDKNGHERGGTQLRVKRTDGRRFHEDPIYEEIKKSLDRFARTLTKDVTAKFLSPFFDFGSKPTVGASHPLGGCPMGDSPDRGAVDEFGRVYRVDPNAPNQKFYPRLYVADGSVIPTALGVNPSLTISAVAVRIAEKIVEELPTA